MIKQKLALIAIFLTICFWGLAQDNKKDSTGLSTDSVRLKNGKVVNIQDYVNRFDPTKALFLSAIFPGTGQIYNKKYWKVPLVWGGLFGMFKIVKFYNDAETKYKNQLFYNINNPDPANPTGTVNPVSGLQTSQLRTIVDQARRQRDYFTILTGLCYILQIVDAHVDAHLKEFDVNPRFQVRVEPSFSPAYGLGMGVTLRF